MQLIIPGIDTVKSNFATSIKCDLISYQIMGFRKNLFVVCCV